MQKLEKQRGTNSAHLQVVGKDFTRGPLDFDDIFNRFGRYVAAVALRLLGDETDVDDIVQEVFWDCAKKVHKIRDMEHARRWLIQVTVRKTRRHLRKRKLMAVFHPPLPQTVDPPMPSAGADDRAAVIQLFSILDRLPVNYRLAWSLRHLEGAELREVAEACGCSLATAKRWIGAAQDAITGGDDD